MSPIVLLFKSLIPAHTRRLKTGKVVNVRQYTDKRTKRLEDDKTLDMFADDGKDDLFGDAPEPVRNLSFTDYLKRGDAKGATEKLRDMSYQEAQEAALRAGFSMPHIPKDKRRDGSGVVAALADQLTRAAAQKTDGFGLRAKPREDDPETALRATWSEMGVPKARQDELIAQIADKAKPGAKVGPWTIGGEAPKPKDTITTPRQEMIDEHKRLVDVLESPSRKDDKVEAKKQKEELEGYEAKPAAPAAAKQPWATRYQEYKDGVRIPAELYDGLPSMRDGVIRVKPVGDGRYDVINDMGGALQSPWATNADAVTARDAAMRLYGRTLNNEPADLLGSHRKAVKQAMMEGKPVPPEVLADYPDLRAIKPAKPADDTPQVDAMIARAKALGFDGIGIKASLELYRNGKNPGQGVTSREEGIASLERMLAAAEAKAKPAPRVTAVTRGDVPAPDDDHPAPKMRASTSSLSEADRARWLSLHQQQHEIHYHDRQKLGDQMDRVRSKRNKAETAMREAEAGLKGIRSAPVPDPEREREFSAAVDKARAEFDQYAKQLDTMASQHEILVEREEALGKQKNAILPGSGDLRMDLMSGSRISLVDEANRVKDYKLRYRDYFKNKPAKTPKIVSVKAA